ncbi:MAG: C39 family peptidase, partial [Anaerolineales bacterium]|nr:C39 family peptidase [Anaerolineales bacterium]
MQKRFNRKRIVPILLALGILVFFFPPVYSRVMPRIDGWISSVKYRINPPDKAIFQPQQQSQVDIAVTQLMQTRVATQTLDATLTAPQTPGPTLTPTVTSTPLPASVNLTGFKYVDQRNRWNYCGPANLTMALDFVGWGGNRDDIARVIKPGIQDPKLDFIQKGRSDVNVMPYELVDFVNDETEYRALSRLGGDIDLAKRLLAADFPFIAEKGYYEEDYT